MNKENIKMNLKDFGKYIITKPNPEILFTPTANRDYEWNTNPDCRVSQEMHFNTQIHFDAIYIDYYNNPVIVFYDKHHFGTPKDGNFIQIYTPIDNPHTTVEIIPISDTSEYIVIRGRRFDKSKGHKYVFIAQYHGQNEMNNNENIYVCNPLEIENQRRNEENSNET